MDPWSKFYSLLNLQSASVLPTQRVPSVSRSKLFLAKKAVADEVELINNAKIFHTMEATKQ